MCGDVEVFPSATRFTEIRVLALPQRCIEPTIKVSVCEHEIVPAFGEYR